MIVVYFDGLAEPRNPGGVATYGFVIYENGKKICEDKGLATKPWSKDATNNVAEYTGMIEAMSWLVNHHYTNQEVVLNGDSQLCIFQMQGIYDVKAPRIIPLYVQAIELSKKFKKIKFKWIPREQNKEADRLSNLGFREYWESYKSQKALEIEINEIQHVYGSIYNVREYEVNLDAYTCTCEDYKRSNRNSRLQVKLPCKHILAVFNIKNARQ